MFRRTTTVLLLLTATAVADEPAPAPVEAPVTKTGTVKGKITDQISEEGLPAATIQLKGPGGDQTLATELDGTYTLQLAPGTYTITFSTPEFIDVSRTVVVTADKTVDLSIVLEPMP